MLAGHEEVYDAIRDREPDEARSATRRHFDSAAKRPADRADVADV